MQIDIKLWDLSTSTQTAITTTTSGIQIHKNVVDELKQTELYLPNVEISLIKRQDIITINDEAFMVYDVERETLIGTNRFNYTLTLVDPTIILQSYNMPSVSITHHLEGNKYTFKDQIKRMYSISKCKITFDYNLLNSDFDKECPEGQYEGRNLFEILNDLAGFVGYRVLIVNNNDALEIVFQKIDGNATRIMDGYGLIQEKYYEKGDEFITGFDSQLQKVVSNNGFSNNNGYISCRSDEVEYTDDNAELIVQNDITYIKNIKCKMPTASGDSLTYYVGNTKHIKTLVSSYTMQECDITRFVVDKNSYDAKLIMANISSPDAKAFIVDATMPHPGHPTYYKVIGKNENLLNYKQWFVYYNNNKISGLSTNLNKKIFGLTTGNMALCEACYLSTVWKWYDDLSTSDKNNLYLPVYPGSQSYGTDFREAPREALFKIDYDGYNDVHVVFNKYGINTPFQRIMVDNQENASVVYEKVIEKETDKMSRYGDPFYICKMIIPDNVTLTNIDSSYYITRNNIKYVLYDYILEYNKIGVSYITGKFVKNRVKRNIFTGVNNTLRYTSIMSQSTALFRQDIINNRMVVSKHYIATDEDDIGYDPFLKFILINGEEAAPKFSLLLKPSGNLYYFDTPTNMYYKNNTCLFETHFKSNASAGVMITDADASKQICKDVLYVDENGEFEDLTYCLENTMIKSHDTINITQANNKPILCDYDGAYISTLDNEKTITGVFKDNKEQYGLVLNYSIGSDDENIYVNKNIVDILMNGGTSYVFIADHSDERYFQMDSGVVNIDYINNSVHLDTDYLEIRGVDLSYIKYWGYGMHDGENYITLIEIPYDYSKSFNLRRKEN